MDWWRGNISRMTWLLLDTSLQTLISMMVAAPLLNHPFFQPQADTLADSRWLL
jgi:hypothetical protein